MEKEKTVKVSQETHRQMSMAAARLEAKKCEFSDALIRAGLSLNDETIRQFLIVTSHGNSKKKT